MKRNIIPDVTLQNEIQKNKILNSRDFYKGRSFRFAHEWQGNFTYFNDEYVTDFVTYKNVLLACNKTHESNFSTVPDIIYEGSQPVGVTNTEYWSFVLSGIVNTEGKFKVQFRKSVEDLPEDINNYLGEIFVVGPVSTSSGNTYEEYIAIHTPGYDEDYVWELIGGSNVEIDPSNYITKDEFSTYNEEIDSKYQPKGEYATSRDVVVEITLSEKELKTWVESQKYLKEIPDEYITTTDLADITIDGGTDSYFETNEN